MATQTTAGRSLEDRYAEVCDRVAGAARRAGRQPDQIILVAVTKYADPDQTRALIDLGHRDFGENRVQQLVQRAAMVDEYLARLRVLPSSRPPVRHASESLFGAAAQPGAARPLRWHMIGHLQRNKARKIIEIVRLVHSVDSLRLAEELQQIALRRDRVVEVLIQVNCSGEESKFGCPMPAAIPLAEQIESMAHLRLRGLMTMAPFNDNPEASRPTFARCRELFEELRETGFGEGRINLLSMGMSGDFEVAISEGANLVRVGSAIFGAPTHAPADEDDDAE